MKHVLPEILFHQNTPRHWKEHKAIQLISQPQAMNTKKEGKMTASKLTRTQKANTRAWCEVRGWCSTGKPTRQDSHEHLPNTAGREGPTFQQMCHEIWLPRPKERNTQNTEENNRLNINNRIKATSNSLKKENAPRDPIFKISAAIVRKTVKFLQNA